MLIDGRLRPFRHPEPPFRLRERSSVTPPGTRPDDTFPLNDGEPTEAEAALVARSRDELRRIRFQQTVTSGWTEGLKLGAIAPSPVAAERSATGSTAMARFPLTYPEIVTNFHAYASDLTKDGESLIVGIDELDKLSPEAAARFMNEIKAIFDAPVPRCYYLVSVSEEALASFEQRGLPSRDVFDTAFDEMLHVGQLGLDATVAMLGRRIIDVPRGVAQLCHALAGGLPRDAVRTIRMIVAARDEHGITALGGLARLVCTRQLADRLHGLRTALRLISRSTSVVAVASWADALSLGDVTTVTRLPDEMLNRLERDGESAALRLVALHACSFYHLATTAAFFADATGDDLANAQAAVSPGFAASVEVLARARNELSLSWALAWESVSAFRAAWKMPTLPVPAIPEGKASPAVPEGSRVGSVAEHGDHSGAPG
jgi:hypothetical protein